MRPVQHLRRLAPGAGAERRCHHRAVREHEHASRVDEYGLDGFHERRIGAGVKAGKAAAVAGVSRGARAVIEAHEVSPSTDAWADQPSNQAPDGHGLQRGPSLLEMAIEAGDDDRQIALRTFGLAGEDLAPTIRYGARLKSRNAIHTAAPNHNSAPKAPAIRSPGLGAISPQSRGQDAQKNSKRLLGCLTGGRHRE